MSEGVMMRKILVLICILSLLVPAVVLAGCGSGGDSQGSDSESPESVAEAFWTAAMTGDAATSWSLLSEELQTGLKNKEAWANSGGVTNSLGSNSIEADKATITGDTAEVTVRIMNGDTEITTSDVSLVKEDGVWKVQMP